jgi:hypothetical protein
VNSSGAGEMPQYVMKVLIDFEARDDIEARRAAAEVVQKNIGTVGGVRDIVLHAKDDNKSIKITPDGTFIGQWNKGGSK